MTNQLVMQRVGNVPQTSGCDSSSAHYNSNDARRPSDVSLTIDAECRNSNGVISKGCFVLNDRAAAGRHSRTRSEYSPYSGFDQGGKAEHPTAVFIRALKKTLCCLPEESLSGRYAGHTWYRAGDVSASIS